MVGRFTSVDPIKSGLNWYSYCDNNPVTRTDKTGEAWETVFDVLSLVGSIAEVCANPYDLWAWGGLAGDVIDLIPFVGGVGETVRGVKAVVKVSDAVDDIVDTAKAIDRVADAVDNIHDAGRTIDNASEGFELIIKNSADPDKVDDVNKLFKKYDSYYEYKKDFGKAGDGREWHHIVEQNQIKNSGFAPGDIYTKSNTISLDKETHRLISSHYSSKQKFTNGQTVREWLSGQSFEDQYRYGLDYLKSIGVVIR